MKTYSGICIGGSMDGARIEAERPMYETPVREGLPEAVTDFGVRDARAMRFGLDVYAHTNMHFVDGKGVEEVGFWLHADYPTLKDALNHMADVYSNATKATRQK